MAVYRVGSNKSSVNNFPVVRPTLDLDFSNSKTLDPRITFTRSSGGSYVGADGLIKYAGVNEARFDHDPATGESLGLLTEEQRTNLLIRSEEFNDAAWGSAPGERTVTSNQLIAPDGTLTADLLTANGTNASHFVSQQLTLSAEPYAYSVFAKAGTNNFVQLRGFNAFGSPTANFNLQSGTTGTISGTATGSSIINYGNGWYRCVMIFTPTAATGSVGFYVVSSTTAGSGEFNTLNTSIYLWGAQLERGSFPTSYIPTQGSTRTRAADNTTITGKNFSEWYRQDEGTICIESTNLSVHGGSNRFPYLAQIDDGTNNNRISFDFSVLFFEPPLSRFNGYRYNFVVTSNGVTLAEIGPVGSSKNSAKWVAGIKSNDFITTTSASPGITYKSSNGTPKNTMNRLQLGAGFGARFTGTIKKLTYYPRRLPNSQLQALTR